MAVAGTESGPQPPVEIPITAPSTTSTARLPFVLVAESDVSRAARCVEAVQEFRLGALVARDGTEATHILDAIGLPSVLIVNFSLPGRDALQLVTTLRERAPEVPVLVLAPCEELRQALLDRYRTIGLEWAALSAASSGDIRALLRQILRASPATRAAAPTERLTLHELLESARRMTGAAGAAAYLRAASGGTFHAQVLWTSRIGTGAPYCEPRIFDWIRESRQPIIVPALGGEPVVPLSDEHPDRAIRGLVAVPVLDSTQNVVGVLCVFDTKPLEIDVDDLNAFKMLGHSAARLPQFRETVNG